MAVTVNTSTEYRLEITDTSVSLADLRDFILETDGLDPLTQVHLQVGLNGMRGHLLAVVPGAV